MEVGQGPNWGCRSKEKKSCMWLKYVGLHDYLLIKTKYSKWRIFFFN
jgi:hypothetical protein